MVRDRRISQENTENVGFLGFRADRLDGERSKDFAGEHGKRGFFAISGRFLMWSDFRGFRRRVRKTWVFWVFGPIVSMVRDRRISQGSPENVGFLRFRADRFDGEVLKDFAVT